MIKKSTGPALGAIAALAAGFSLSMMGTGTATADTVCADNGVSVGNGICQLTFTNGTTTFTPVAKTSKLEAVLVAGGGDSVVGYGGGGGGVSLVNFTNTTGPLAITVGAADEGTEVSQASSSYGVVPGNSGGSNGGDSGGGPQGWQINNSPNDVIGAAGGGAGASPVNDYTGGVGIEIANVAPTGSLFAGDTACYGGGGGIQDNVPNYGTATCGGGYVTTSSVVVDPVANSGGGAGSIYPDSDTTVSGASGVVIVRWEAPVLATTGVDINPLAIPGALVAIVVGATAAFITRKRRSIRVRTANVRR